MVKLDKDQIHYLSELSRIHCSEEEQDSLLEDLKKILDYAEQLNEIDTEHVTPCDHVLSEIVNVMREDKVGDTLPRDFFLDNAPEQVGGLIRVPPVMKNQ